MTTLAMLDSYLDAVPRSAAHVLEVGPFTVFVGDGPYPYYARPSKGRASSHHFLPEQVRAVAKLQRDLGIPVAFEWIHDLDPSLTAACADVGLDVVQRPLLAASSADVAHRTIQLRHPSVLIQIVEAHDVTRIREQRSVAHIGFRHGGTAVSDVGVWERSLFPTDPVAEAWTALRIENGLSVVAVAVDEANGVVGVGSMQPVLGNGVSAGELTGIAVLPSHRRRGIASLLTAALMTHGASLGVEMLLLSAQGDEVARIYERVGFVRVGTFGEAAPGTTTSVAD